MGSNSATIWSSISTGFANLWSNQDLPRGKSTSDCQFHFLPPSLFENTYLLFASILHCSKREFILFKKTYPLLWIHISMFKKRIKSTPNTRMLCFHRYFNVKKGIHSVTITYIFFDPYINVPRREFTHNLCFNPYLNVRKENLLFQGCIRCCTDEKER